MEANMQAVIDAARLSDKAQRIEATSQYATWLHPTVGGPVLTRVDIESGGAAPFRKRGTIQVFDAASFNDILAANHEAGNITIYVNRDVNTPSIVAVMNGNGETGPGWGDFRAEIVFRFTSQWLKWKAIDGKMFGQLAFAEFIEDNLADVVSPAGADMLEIAQELSVKRSVDFKSNIRLQDGRLQFQNIENLEAQVGAGQIAIPPTITLGIAPVFGLPPFKVDARLRYRVENGKLTLGIKMQRVEDIMAAVVNDMVVGTVAQEGRAAVKGIEAPTGAVQVEGLAPAETK